MFYLLPRVWGHIGLSIIVMFQFACFDFQINWVIRTSTVGHTLEVGMKEDCHEFACRLSKVFRHSTSLLQSS